MALRKEFVFVLVLVMTLLAFTYFEPSPVKKMMDWRTKKNVLAERETFSNEYQTYKFTNGQLPELTFDFRKGKHFWNPQVVIWVEDSAGHYLETLFVTASTARGLFYSGRTASNFKKADDAKKEDNSPTRRVDALPYWSHKRNHRYPDGFYSPPPDHPLPDAITAATPRENFNVEAMSGDLQTLRYFKIYVEVNVAFDENEYYSEYDFTDDSVYHNGTGLLGQPSLVYSATIRKKDPQRFYILSLVGHGHHSGATGELFTDTKTVSTAKYVFDRIVVGITEGWHDE